jgi:hypothetical protein
MTFSCARAQVKLTTKLTTERLDVLGRRWTMCRQEPGFQGNLDIAGRSWTLRRVLHNRRLPVRFLSHLPRKPCIHTGCSLMACTLFFVLLTSFGPNADSIGRQRQSAGDGGARP